MAIVCPNCSQEFDITLFQFGKPLVCDCGRWIDPLDWWLGPGASLEKAKLLEEKKLRELKILADRICFLIVSSDYRAADVKIEAANAKRRCEELFPGKGDVFDLVYGSRFKRLWSQFRGGSLDDERR
jgi:hypothetical protein